MVKFRPELCHSFVIGNESSYKIHKAIHVAILRTYLLYFVIFYIYIILYVGIHGIFSFHFFFQNETAFLFSALWLHREKWKDSSRTERLINLFHRNNVFGPDSFYDFLRIPMYVRIKNNIFIFHFVAARWLGALILWMTSCHCPLYFQ